MADRSEPSRSAPRSDPPSEARVVRRQRKPQGRPARSRRRNVLVGVGIVLVAALGIAGIGAAWGLWSFSRIDRVALDLAETGPTTPRNFLVVGSDSREGIEQDDPGAGGMLGPGAPAGRRADSLMVARVDPQSDRVDLLSIPRDLWVPIGESGEQQRINTAYSESAQTVVDTVQDSLGIPIHHFVEIDFVGFQQLVDALGGVPMYFDHPVRDRNSGLFVYEKGCRVLDGPQSLAFARARHLQWSDGVEWHGDPTGDLGRMTRQQLLVRAAAARAQALGLGDVGKVRSLVDAAVGSVTLDDTLGIGDLVGLGNRFSELDPDRMQTHPLPVVPHRTDAGAAVVLLDEAAAGPVLDIFRGDLSAAPVTTTTAPPPSPDEITVDVINSTGTDGEARRVSFVLGEGDFVPGIVEGGEPVGRSEIAYPESSRAMAELVSAWLSPRAELVEDDDLAPGHVLVRLGQDFQHVAEPDEAPPTTAAPAPDPPERSTDTTAAPTTTTTTAPGWTPGVPPEGVSCS